MPSAFFVRGLGERRRQRVARSHDRKGRLGDRAHASLALCRRECHSRARAARKKRCRFARIRQLHEGSLTRGIGDEGGDMRYRGLDIRLVFPQARFRGSLRSRGQAGCLQQPSKRAPVDGPATDGNFLRASSTDFVDESRPSVCGGSCEMRCTRLRRCVSALLGKAMCKMQGRTASERGRVASRRGQAITVGTATATNSPEFRDRDWKTTADFKESDFFQIRRRELVDLVYQQHAAGPLFHRLQQAGRGRRLLVEEYVA